MYDLLSNNFTVLMNLFCGRNTNFVIEISIPHKIISIPHKIISIPHKIISIPHKIISVPQKGHFVNSQAFFVLLFQIPNKPSFDKLLRPLSLTTL